MRERLRSRFLQHLLQIGDHYGNVQQWSDAVRLYERALEINPLAEDFYRRLMTAHLHLDRRADALRVYQRCEQALGASFGVPPSHEIRSLRDDLNSSKANSDRQGHLRVAPLESAGKNTKEAK